MKRPKLLFPPATNETWLDRIEALQREFPHWEFIPATDSDFWEAQLPEADAIVAGRISEQHLKLAGRLKVLFVPFAGVNPFPLQQLQAQGVVVSNSHGSCEVVAERALTLALSLLGRIVEFHNKLCQGQWLRSGRPEHFWESLQHKECGLLGIGSIGTHLARLLRAFSCSIAGFGRRNRKETPAFLDSYSSNLIELIDRSDVIFLSLPLTTETTGIIDAEILGRMRGKYIINIGRSALIKEEALYRSLINAEIAGAALDVHFQYPRKQGEHMYPSAYPIHELPNVVLTPHNASHTALARVLNIDGTVDNIRHYLRNGRPRHVVDLAAGY